MNKKQTNKLYFQRFCFVLPALIFLIIFMAYPIVYSLVISFTKFDGIRAPQWVGLKNYINVFRSSEFLQVLKNSFYLILLGIPSATLIPLFISVFIFDGLKGEKFFKTVFLLPSVFSVTIVGILFRTFFSYDGPLNQVLRLIGSSALAKDWLAEGRSSIPIIVLAMVWSNFGVNMLIFLAGMASVPSSVYESATLDGIGFFRKTFQITIPMIWSVLEFVVVNNTITLLSSMFGYIYTMTDGGPGYESTVLEYLLYIKGFRLGDLGYASCIALLLFILIFFLSKTIRAIFHNKEVR